MATEQIKLSAAKERVKWMRKSEIFTVKSQWNMVKDVEDNPLEYYVDYNDKLSDEQIEYLEDEGQRGYEKLIESIWDNIFASEIQEKDEQRDDIIFSLDASDFKDEYLKKIFDEEMDEEEFDEDEVVEFIKNNFHFIDDVSEEFKDIICEYQTYDFNLDEIFSNNRYNKTLCIELDQIDHGEFQKLIQEEITAFEKANGLPELYLPDCFEMVYLKGNEIDTVNEIIDASEAINNELSEISFRIIQTIELHDDDGEVYDMEIDKTIDFPVNYSSISFEETDEHVENSYTTIFDMDISTPKKEDTEKLNYLMEACVPIGYYGDINASIQCQVDEFLVIEAIFKKDGIYTTFGYDQRSKVWTERKITSLDVCKATELKSANELDDLLLTIGGELVCKKEVA